MTETTLIAVPCRVITLRVELGDDSGASTLESLVLEAVDGGRRTVGELGRLFSLPHRLMLDVVHGLWSRGFLAVDFSTHSLRSTARADQVAPRGEDGQHSLATRVRQRRFLFDPVTATVLPHEQGHSRVPHGALEMPLARGISEDDLPQTELLRAVRHAVDSDGRRRSDHHRVLNVSFANPVLSPPHAVCWRTVETVVKRDPASGLVAAVPVSPPPGWGRRALELFQARITDLVRSRPESRFVRLLSERQIPEAHSPQSLRSQLLELEGLARELTRAADERVPALHDELTGRALRVWEEVAEARRARCSAQSVAAGAGVDWVVQDLVESATRQLVLAVPEITYDALHPVLPLLELAAKRGVTLVFLWGSHPYAKLEARVATALFDLQARFPQAVLLEQRSSGSAASVVVCDDRAAFVGSRSVLSGDTGSGVLVGPADGEDGQPECVSELLGWARRTYPYWETGRGIALAPADFGRREGAAERGGPQRPPLPELEERWDEDPAAHRTGWAAAWGRVLRRLAEDVDDVHRGAPVVRVAWDGMYVELAQRLASGAVERLALTDDTADPDGAEEQLAERLSGLRGKGVVVHLQHPPSSEARRREGAYAELLRRLATERTLRATRARARAVLSDHEVVVGSHHPLGGGGTGPARGRPPGELGLHIVGTAFTADFARELGIPDWYGVGGSAEPPVYLPPLPALDAAPVRDDPWAVLDSRRERGEPPEVLRREAAGLLLGGTPGERERRTWARWLADDAWARGAFVEALLLTPLLGGPAGAGADLAAAAVPVEHGPLGYRLYAGAVELASAPAGHRAVALVGAVAEMLMHGDATGAEVCEVLLEGPAAEGLPPSWVRLGGAACAYFRQEPVPLPLQEANEWAARQARLTDVRERWERLGAELSDFERISHHFTFQDGEKLHRGLFRDGRMLAVIRDAARQEQPPGHAAGALAALPRSELEARAVMDRVSAELGVRKIEWRHHMAYAGRIAEFLREARALAGLGGDGTGRDTRRLPVLSAGQREFARQLDREWHALLAESHALGEPARHPAAALLQALSALPKAGQEGA